MAVCTTRLTRRTIFLVSDPLCLSSSSWAHLIRILLLLVLHPVNRDNWHLLANEMASDFTVASQYSQREQLVCSLRIKLHALNRLGVFLPSFDTSAQNGVHM
jgi:hypothetical protein